MCNKGKLSNTKKKKTLVSKLRKVMQQKKIIRIRKYSRDIKKMVWEENNLRLMGQEFAANQYQSYFPVWNGIGHYYEPSFFMKDRVLFKNGIMVSISRKLYKQASLSEVDKIIKDLHEKIPSDSRKAIWSETLDKNFLARLFSRLTEKQKYFIENSLSKSFLPVTGAHGDLKDEHFFKDRDNKNYIIDWEFFRPEGSIITDILRLYSMRRIKELKKKEIKISQYDPMLVLKHGLDCCIDLSEIGGEMEIALLTMITNCCIHVTGSSNRRLEKFPLYIDLIMKKDLETDI